MVKSAQNLSYDNVCRKNDKLMNILSHDDIYYLICTTWWNFVGGVMNKNYYGKVFI